MGLRNSDGWLSRLLLRKRPQLLEWKLVTRRIFDLWGVGYVLVLDGHWRGQQTSTSVVDVLLVSRERCARLTSVGTQFATVSNKRYSKENSVF